MDTPPIADARIEGIRRFNRFYTQQIGVLQKGLLESAFSLTEARVLYELAHADGLAAATLARSLALDAGYLSRILRRFAEHGLVQRRPSAADARQDLVFLTGQGREIFTTLETRSRAQVADMLRPLPPHEQRRLTEAMAAIEAILGTPQAAAVPYILRPHHPGDLGWVISRHAALYAEEYGWNGEFEALVAEIVAGFIRSFDPARERCWIAERAGERVGSILLVQQSAATAKLRLLLVEPSARGLGIGARLVSECLRFARAAGYKEVLLWTNDVLHTARHIYQRAGFRLVAEQKHHSFGHDLVGQDWRLDLTAERLPG